MTKLIGKKLVEDNLLLLSVSNMLRHMAGFLVPHHLITPSINNVIWHWVRIPVQREATQRNNSIYFHILEELSNM
uniref:Uncharacterized protein n=1 Tax=viral metagenome TaxID=1070528 RepID=A0A6M3JR92_9ZZZZ